MVLLADAVLTNNRHPSLWCLHDRDVCLPLLSRSLIHVLAASMWTGAKEILTRVYSLDRTLGSQQARWDVPSVHRNPCPWLHPNLGRPCRASAVSHKG